MKKARVGEEKRTEYIRSHAHSTKNLISNVQKSRKELAEKKRRRESSGELFFFFFRAKAEALRSQTCPQFQPGGIQVCPVRRSDTLCPFRNGVFSSSK